MNLLFAEKCIIFVLAKRREPINKGFSPLFLAHIKEEIHRKLEILYALADFLNALAEIFLALSVREMTI